MAHAAGKVLKKALGSEKGSKLLTAGTVASIGFNGYMGYSDYRDSRAQGNGVIESVARAGASFAAGEVLGPVKYFALMGAQAIPKGIVAGAETMGKVQRQMNRQSRLTPFANATFNDYNQAFTMRQAGMQAAQQSKYNLQQALIGNEAQYLR